jgi:hypothetical protein
MKIRPYFATENTLRELVGQVNLTNQLLNEIRQMLADKKTQITPEQLIQQHGLWAKQRVFTTELTSWERE